MKRIVRKMCWPCFFVQCIVTLAMSLAGLVSLALWSSWVVAGICVVAAFVISSPSSCMIERETEDH